MPVRGHPFIDRIRAAFSGARRHSPSGRQGFQQLESALVLAVMLPYGRSECDMSAITTSGTIATRSGIAPAEEIRAAFTEHRRELTWLAEFLTDDDLMASACVGDARNLTDNIEDEICEECVRRWPREATIRSALDLKRTRIAELSSAYENGAFVGQQHPPLSLDRIDLVVRESDAIRLRLDSLCRFVLILCGVEQRSTGDAALLLGISKPAVEAAYSSALESLEVIYCQAVLESYGCFTA